MRRFLQLVVCEALGGRAGDLKEYPIGVAVFDRPASFDPSIDPIVRVEARRLRAKLDNYYQGEGRGDSRSGPMTDSLYTMGSSGKALRQFVEPLRRAGVDLVIDVRLQNTSQLAGFGRLSLPASTVLKQIAAP